VHDSEKRTDVANNAAGAGAYQVMREVLCERRWNGEADSSALTQCGCRFESACDQTNVRFTRGQTEHQHCRRHVLIDST